MGSLDAQAFGNFERSTLDSLDNFAETSYGYYDRFSHDSATFAQGNPFAAGYYCETPSPVKSAARYDQFAQGFPPQYTAYDADGTSFPATARSYNPFCQEYPVPGPEQGVFYRQGRPYEAANSFVEPAHFSRAEPAQRLLSGSYGQQYPGYNLQEAVHPRFLHNDAVIPYSCRNLRSQRLLWLSEEEAEIIRLIRLSQMKEGLTTGDLSSPVQSPADNRENFGHSSGKVNTPPNISVEEFSLPGSAYSISLKESARTLDSARTMDSDDGLAAQRLKAKDIEAQCSAAVRIQRTWRRLRMRSSRSPKNALKMHPKGREDVQQKQRGRRRRISVDQAANVIQRVWRTWIKCKMRKKPKSAKSLPRSLKEFYEIIRLRHTSKGLKPPSYVKFLRLLERIHAATEGARVRRRLKSRRLQAVVKEIKEIRVLLEDMSMETTPEPAEHFLTQLSSQLRQKQVQLYTALQGPGDTARYLLRRGPATPLIVHGSRSTSPTRQDNSRNPNAEIGISSVRSSVNYSAAMAPDEVPDNIEEPKLHDDQVTKASSRSNVSRIESQLAGLAEKATVVYYSDSSNKSAASTPAVKAKDNVTRPGDDQVSDSGYDSMGTSRTVSEDMDQPELIKPKRPFLRRKSVAIAPQKLDWSKVKPMVSSRLEPELKTRLQRNKMKDHALKKKMNYSKVKSRLFDYKASSAQDEIPSCVNNTVADPPKQVQGYAELHTENDGENWGPSSVEEFLEREVAQNFRYGDGNSEQYVESSTSRGPPLTDRYVNSEVKTGEAACTVSKGPSERYVNSEVKIVEAACTVNRGPPDIFVNGGLNGINGYWDLKGSAAEENGQLTRKEQTHSFRYSEAVSEPPSPRSNAGTAKNHPSNPAAEACFVTPELEATFKHVLLLKNENQMTVQSLFGSAPKERSTIPRLCPDSHIFHGTFLEKRKLHEMLIHEGCASKLRPDSLAFLSTRD